MKTKVNMFNMECDIVCSRYSDGHIAIRLVSDGQPVATATVNVPGCPLDEHEVLIKDYAENEGVLAALAEAGVINPTNIICKVGHDKARVCELLIDPPPILSSGLEATK